MRTPRPLLALTLAACAASGAASCAEGASVNVKLAPGFVPGRTTVSVLGVFRDGRMSADSWIPIGPPLSTVLGQEADLCDAAYGDRLQQERPELYTFLDEDTRSNGITEDMLAKIAPQADGELILTISVHGRIVQATPEHEPPPPPAAAPTRGGGGRGRGQTRPGPARSTAPGGLDLSASLYSIHLHKSVARLNMNYTGTSVEEAFHRFAAEVGALVPGSTCSGWHWKPAP
jgi:hypothetical protein